MQRELIGSFAIYVIFWAVPGKSWRLFACLAIALIIDKLAPESDRYMCFVTGAVLYLTSSRLQMKIPGATAAILALGIFLGGKPFYSDNAGLMYTPVLRALSLLRLDSYVSTIGASAILLAVLRGGAPANLLRRDAPQFLGRISFSIYLIHRPLTQSLLAYSYGLIGQSIMGTTGCIAIFFAVTFFLSAVFNILVDEPTLKLIRKFRQTVGSRVPIQAV